MKNNVLAVFDMSLENKFGQCNAHLEVSSFLLMHMNANHAKYSVLLFPNEKNSSFSRGHHDPFELVADELSILRNRLRSHAGC